MWGTGNVAREIYKKMKTDMLIAFVESVPRCDTVFGIPVIRPEDVHLEGDDILLVAIANAIVVKKYIDNCLNIPEKHVLYYRLDGLENPLHYAARYGKLRQYFNEDVFLDVLKELNVESMLYNADFIIEVCKQNKVEYPIGHERVGGYMHINNIDIESEYIFAPDLLNVWTGNWYKVRKRDK